ncbi:LytS/YhcK type 5TM receptor domain-containing protein [Oceanobacillus sp. FSL H7-0719]|uniref:LytS/YhcK type 5TM receptor domain-containing protein n=1 Tax=Oceanobacillus sp. FSL H7-0719 TaxID=2954507 RepID=UPI00324A9344
MLELLITMVERIGVIVTIAFILTRFRFLRNMLNQEQLDKRQQWTAILFFGFFGIIGTYTGLSVSSESLQFSRWATDLATEEAIANSRVIGVVIAGLLGGPKVGIGAGLIAGAHRFTLGGFTAIACGTATIIAGILTSLLYRKHTRVKLHTAFLIGALAEALQMLIIILVARPFEQAWDLVNIIGIPMIVANGLGTVLVLLIIKSVLSEEEKASAVQAQKTLRIADKTSAHLRSGLHTESAKAVCNIIHREIRTSAVSITNTADILAHIGLGDDHHRNSSPIKTKVTQAAISKGELMIADVESIHCAFKSCPLRAALIAPLKQQGKVVGTLKFYFSSESEISDVNIELINGLSAMMSHQLELAAADQAFQLAKEAEIKALQAQISPHFLFNTLNTIISLTRINPLTARKLLISLSHFLRGNLTSTTASQITLENEMKHVKAFLEIKETRFSNKLNVDYKIDETLLSHYVPPLTLQPIVENAIQHGFRDMDKDCELGIRIQKTAGKVTIQIADNGSGMSEETAQQINQSPVDSDKGSGLALYNVNRRLKMMFGEIAMLQIESKKGKGTKIQFSIPIEEAAERWTG